MSDRPGVLLCGLFALLLHLSMGCTSEADPSSASGATTVPSSAKAPTVSDDTADLEDTAASKGTAVVPADADTVRIGGRTAVVWASSELAPQGGNDYSAANAFDGDRSTAWVEGVEGPGDALHQAAGARVDNMYRYMHDEDIGRSKGELLSIKFDSVVRIRGFAIRPGYIKSPATFMQNGVPRRIELFADSKAMGRYFMRYVSRLHMKTERPTRAVLPDCYPAASTVNRSSSQFVIFEKPIHVQHLSLRLVLALEGSHFQDTAITEWRPIFSEETANDSSAIPGLDVLELVESIHARDIEKRMHTSADIADLRAMYYSFSPNKSPVVTEAPPEYHTLRDFRSGRVSADSDFKYFARVPKPDRESGDDAWSRFFAYTRDSFINKSIVYIPSGTNDVLIGGRSLLMWGGSELYPALSLDQEGHLVRAQEVRDDLGGRECSHQLPM